MRYKQCEHIRIVGLGNNLGLTLNDFMVFGSDSFFVERFGVVLELLVLRDLVKLLFFCVLPSALIITERHRKMKMFIFEL